MQLTEVKKVIIVSIVAFSPLHWAPAQLNSPQRKCSMDRVRFWQPCTVPPRLRSHFANTICCAACQRHGDAISIHRSKWFHRGQPTQCARTFRRHFAFPNNWNRSKSIQPRPHRTSVSPDTRSSSVRHAVSCIPAKQNQRNYIESEV